MFIEKDFISKEDLLLVNDYINTISFNTKEDHVPLHNDLFQNNNIGFDLHTRGEMQKEILDVFSKFSEGFYNKVQSLEKNDYHPPMFSKHYIARYKTGASVEQHFDMSKPQGTYKAYIFWNDEYSGGDLCFPNLTKSINPNPGDMIILQEIEEHMHGISKIESGTLYLSEAWMGPKGKHFMPNKAAYEDVDWEDWEIKGF
jgi:hypothetical protein